MSLEEVFERPTDDLDKKKHSQSSTQSLNSIEIAQPIANIFEYMTRRVGISTGVVDMQINDNVDRDKEAT